MTIIGAGKKCPPFLSRPLSFAKKTARLLRIAVLKAAPVRVRIILSGCVQDQRDHLDRLADCLDGMALAIAAVVYIAGLYINDRAVVVVLAAAGKDVIGLSVALVRVEADLASGIHRRMPEYTSLILHFLRSVQKASHSDLTDTVKGRRLPDADLIVASSNHDLPSCKLCALLLSLDIVYIYYTRWMRILKLFHWQKPGFDSCVTCLF